MTAWRVESVLKEATEYKDRFGDSYGVVSRRSAIFRRFPYDAGQPTMAVEIGPLGRLPPEGTIIEFEQ